MELEFKRASISDVQTLAELASEIWHEYWVEILTLKQIDYMVDNFQSPKAIKEQCENEGYTYYFIKSENKNIGYFGISTKADYLFLSKLYILKEYRHLGIGTLTFEKIKQIASELGFKSIQLTVNKHNKNTISAYKKWGFATINSAVTDIGEGFVMDDYIMECLV